MRVLYTYDIFTKQAFGGISRYVLELARHLPAGVAPDIFAGLHINTYIHEGEAKGLRLPTLPCTGVVREKLSRLAQRTYTALATPDIFHRTYYGVPLQSWGRPVVLTVYDMIHERYPAFYRDGGKLSALKRGNCELADHIIAISHSTRRDLIEFFAIPPEKISVIHLAATEFTASPACRRSLSQNKPYILFVGQRSGYKNFESLLCAYASSARLKKSFDLVCFGGGPVSSTEKQRIESLGVGPLVRFVSGTDEHLRAYYEIARLLVYPSLYEGFGLPVLEAMQSGCPVMCSLSSSLPEVAGAAAVYIGDDLAAQLEQLAFDSSALAQLKHAGQAQATQFTWDRCAAETASIYRSVLKC
jgi:glycosyltransferase involved in cell wall biosynthesis